jgi:hypothetical protein
MPVGAAIGGGIGLIGSLGSALLGSNAATKASGQQVALGEQALGQQEGIWNTLQSAIQPVISLGTNAASGALSTLQKLLTPGPNMTSTLSQIPGFTFAQDWGQKAVQNIGTTTGLGGNTLTAGANFATGLAQQGYGNIVNSLLSLFGTGGNIATGGAGALTSAGTNTSNTIGGTLTGIGQSQAQGTLGTANALSTGVTSGAGSVSNALLLQRLLGGSGGSGIYTGAIPSSGVVGQSVAAG